MKPEDRRKENGFKRLYFTTSLKAEAVKLLIKDRVNLPGVAVILNINYGTLISRFNEWINDPEVLKASGVIDHVKELESIETEEDIMKMMRINPNMMKDDREMMRLAIDQNEVLTIGNYKTT